MRVGSRYRRLAPRAVAAARHAASAGVSGSQTSRRVARALLGAALPDLEAHFAELYLVAAHKSASSSRGGSTHSGSGPGARSSSSSSIGSSSSSIGSDDSRGRGAPTHAERFAVRAAAAAHAAAAVQAAGGDEAAFNALLGSVGLQLGTTKTFFRQHAFDACEALNARAAAKAAVSVQTAVRRRQARLRWQRARQSCVALQCWCRQAAARALTGGLRQARAALCLQRQARRRACLGVFRARRAGCVALQSWARMQPVRAKFVAQRRRHAATKLQAVLARGAAARRAWQRALAAAQWVAARWRGVKGRKVARQKQREARSTAALQQQVEH
jgi:hypothetical protein